MQAPLAELPLLIAKKATSTRIHPVHSHTPLAIAQFLRNDRLLGRCSDERMTSETIREMIGITKTATPAATAAHPGNGSSPALDCGLGEEATLVEFDSTTGGASAAVDGSSAEYARPQRLQNWSPGTCGAPHPPQNATVLESTPLFGVGEIRRPVATPATRPAVSKVGSRRGLPRKSARPGRP